MHRTVQDPDKSSRNFSKNSENLRMGTGRSEFQDPLVLNCYWPRRLARFRNASVSCGNWWLRWGGRIQCHGLGNAILEATASVFDMGDTSKAKARPSDLPRSDGGVRRGVMRTISPTQMYLKIQLEISSGTAWKLSDVLPDAIDAALLSFYGVVGAATVPYEILPTAPQPDVTVLTVPTKHYRRLWAALTMLTSVRKAPARCTVLKATPFWFALFDETLLT